ncbi:hypothetical protein [Sediminitomix flava]|uniref:Uncharacterized protein n=1 Tax=Sediminitomix flava TaxID=379075 RepID=A0A315ZD01_SEDFL|nr:hypothetical protein [Sediminitomix flava]PWJ42989.1 hypothetical protein BC781_102536 [Sediminitomix flava]
MKKSNIFFAAIAAFVLSSCNESDDASIPSESKPITVLPVVEEQITPMTNEHSAKDGAILEGYTATLKDQANNTFVIDDVTLGDSLHFESVTGYFSITIEHEKANVIGENYYLNGGTQGTATDEVVDIQMSNQRYSYIVVDGAQDEVRGVTSEGFEFLPTSNDEFPNFYAYVDGNIDHSLVLSTTRGDIGYELEELKEDYQYTLSVDFTTDGNVKIDLGFKRGDEEELKPIEKMDAIIPESYITNGEDYFHDWGTGYVSGSNKENSDIWFYGVSYGTDKDGDKFDFTQNVREFTKPSFDIDVLNVSYDGDSAPYAYMNVYISGGTHNKKNVKAITVYPSKIRNTVTIHYTDYTQDATNLTWEAALEAIEGNLTFTKWADAGRLQTNFIIRIDGESSNSFEFDYVLKEFNF